MDYQAIGDAAIKTESMHCPVVKDRVLQYDADFGCYECAFLDESVDRNFRNLKKHIEMKQSMAGAERTNVHITLGLKGGRDQIATVKPYQENRSNKNVELKARVLELRTLLGNYRTETVTPIVNLYQEADDSLSAMQLARIAEHGLDSSILMSGDKDLWMVDGRHIDQKTGRIYTVEGYGETSFQEVGNVTPKLVGRGKSWFWHQMLIGDTADNIPGLPKLSAALLNIYKPLKKHNPKRNAGLCGEKTAVLVLENVRNEKEAALIVAEAYRQHYGTNANEMLLEQAFLLWMRRTPRIDDVRQYLYSCGISSKFSDAQINSLRKFRDLCKVQKSMGDF